MAGVWTDLQLAAVLIIFIVLTNWSIDITGSKKVGLVIAIIITYLTVYKHPIILLLVVIFFFGYEAFTDFEEMFEETAGESPGD